jgi:hypothetical protein
MDPKIRKQREDEYFARLEFDRFRKLAEQKAAKMKEQEREELKRLHWMRCPKDGMELKEIEYLGVRIDKCAQCGGIFLDAGELERVFEANREQDGLAAKILNFFHLA